MTEPLRLLHGDCREVMRGMAAESVQSVITSPPYYQKRKYNCPPVVYGKGTEHEWSGELGWEPTPQLFVAHLVECFAECWRVLREDGLLFVNLMDTRIGGGRGGDKNDDGKQTTNRGTVGIKNVKGPSGNGLKPKDMALVPQRFVIAMQEAGWYVRSVIVWAKGESCNPDAPTVPCVVLDCFGGSGTTGRAAVALGRRAICIELQPEYQQIADQHSTQLGLF